MKAARLSRSQPDHLAESAIEGVARAEGDFVAHQDADFVYLLPFVFEAEQGANFEIAGGDVDAAGDLAPVVEVAEDFPVGVAVVDDEPFDKLRAGPSRSSEQAGGVGDGSVPGGCQGTSRWARRRRTRVCPGGRERKGRRMKRMGSFSGR